MFPLPFNFPFRKKDGSLSTIGDEINAGGGGSSYTLPTASANVKGGVKIGEGLTMDGEVLKNNNPTPMAPYTLPTASAETLGGVKVGEGLSINNGVLSTSGGGGSALYRHDIVFKGTTDGAVITIINDSNTSFTDETLKTYFMNKNLTDNNKFVMASGIKVKSNDTSDNITGLFYTSGYNEFRVMTVTSGTWSLIYSSIVDSVSSI